MRVAAAMTMTFLATQALAAPAKPSSAVVDQIQAVLDLRKSAGQKAAELRGKTAEIEKEIGLRDNDGRLQPIDSAGVAEYAKRLMGFNDAKYEKYLVEIQKYKLAQQEYRSLSEQAIRMATAAYKPTPAISSGEIASGPPKPTTEDDVPSFIGNHVDYAPVFSERVPENASGSTDDSGKVLIGNDAFDSPGKLAFTLYHEGQHFENLLTPGLDLRNNPNEEVLERTMQRPSLKSTFGLTDEEIARFDKVLESERIRAKKWDALLTQGLDPYKKSQQVAFPGGYKPLWMEDGVSQEVDSIIARTKELRESQKRLDEERLARERAEKEYAERRSRAHREEIDSEAARCGHRMHYDTDNKTMLGFGGFWLSRYQVPFDFLDMKLAFLMTRACQDIEFHPDQPAPAACNTAAPLLHERASRGDFAAKLKYLTGTNVGTYSQDSECMKNILANADKITDTQSFNSITSAFQKQLSKRRAKEAKRDRERDEREKKDSARDNRRGPIVTDPDRRHYYWDPGCNCRIYVD